MTSVPIRCQGLGRDYGSRRALDALDLEVQAGQIAALVGPNGSGKTTLLELLAGLLRPSRGSARVLGLDPWRQRARVMRSARFAFAPPALWERLTAREHLERLAALSRARVAAAEIDAALATVGLRDRADERVRSFSFGMRQRLALAQALLPRPALLVLDEPADGLDPLAVLELRGVLRDLRDRHGTTVLLSSHLLAEVEELVDTLVVLHEGRVLLRGDPRGLLEANRRLRIATDDSARTRAVLSECGIDAQQVGTASDELELRADGLELADLSALLSSRGISLRSFHHQRPTLEQVLVRRLARARVHRTEEREQS